MAQQSYINFLIFPYCPCLMVQFINIALIPTKLFISRHFLVTSRQHKSYSFIILLFFVNWYVNHTNLTSSLLLSATIHRHWYVCIPQITYFQNRYCCTPNIFLYQSVKRNFLSRFLLVYSLYKHTYILSICPLAPERCCVTMGCIRVED